MNSKGELTYENNLTLLILLTVFSINTFAQDTTYTVLEGHMDWVNSVVFSPDGILLASSDFIHSVVFSPDGILLASRGAGATIRLWELPDTRVDITVLPVDTPAIGDQLTLNINITDSENVTGYQAKVIFDETALRYVEGANGDYLPDNSFFVPPVVEGDEVILGATSLAEDSSGDGTLATLTFEFIAIKESTLTFKTRRMLTEMGLSISWTWC